MNAASRWMITGWLLWALSGCANLAEVRQFSAESAKLSGYTPLTERYLGSYERSQFYLLSEDARRRQQALDLRKKEARASLMAVHEVAARYMATLAALAGDDAFRIDAPIKAMGAGLVAAPELGLDRSTVSAASTLAGTLANAVAGRYQRREVRAFLDRNGADAQQVFDGLVRIAGNMRASLDNERKDVLGFFEIGSFGLEADRTVGPYLARLARGIGADKAAEYDAADASASQALAGLEAVAQGHRYLMANLERLSATDVRARLAGYRVAVQDARARLVAW